MEWRQVETTEERPFGMWSRADLDAMAEAERRADMTARRIGEAVDREARRPKPEPRPPGAFRCPDCLSTFRTAAARGAHRAGRHGYRSPGRGSLPAA